ncbi:MAG: PqqD family protein [Clostridiales bacterium]|nr:PqqD family protein [Clostridiales bacterium]
MKLKKEFITHETQDESLLIPTGSAAFSGLIKGNKTLGAILELLKEDTTEEEVVAAMKERFDAPDGVIEKDVRYAIEKLCEVDALEE